MAVKNSNNINDTPRQAYNASIQLAFDNNGSRTPIESEKISYVMIEHDYENNNIPTIYVSMSVSSDLYADIIKYKNIAKFYLVIKRTNQRSIASLSKTTIEGLFTYIPSTTNPNFQEDLVDQNAVDASYKRIMIGLVSVDLTNKLRKTFNNVYNNIDQKTLVGIALEGTNCVIESLEYNEYYDSILIPPITSRLKLLEYIFNKDNFYDTNFRFFMDFDKSYLLSKCGNYVDAGDGQLQTTIVDIRSVTENESYYDGIAVQNGCYYIYINPANSNVAVNVGTEKVANQIVSVDEDVDTQEIDLDINNTEDSKTKQIFIRTDNAALYKNELETNTIIVEIVKQHIDGSAFTPNKCIIVNNFGDYAKYNGKYLIIYKKEFFKCIAGEFVMSCNVGLKKIGNIQPAKSSKNNKGNGYGSSSARRRSTANRR